MFGAKPPGGAPVPPREKYIPMRPLESKKQAALPVGGDYMPGSNSWAWNGKTGTYLVNDPHLGQSVPGIWYTMRLKISNKEWVVGAALPGLPGIIIGMNQSLAWGFTNTGEDVDDYLAEKISPDGNSYLAEIRNGQEIWEPIQKKNHTLHINGSGDEVIESLATRRGPLIKRPDTGGGFFSRQWLALRAEALRLPVVKLNRAQNWEELNSAIDGLRVPAQNVLMADGKGNIGYRVSGSGVLRKITGRIVQPGTTGEWVGIAPPEERRREFVSADPNAPTFMATANQRIWVDEFGQGWASDDRADRIREVLSSRSDFTATSMLELQLDTQGRFRRQLLNWVADNADSATRSKHASTIESWRTWNGSSVANPQAFTESIDVETELLQILLGRVRETFLGDLPESYGYSWYTKRAWMVTILDTKDGMNVFGLNDSEVASSLLRFISGRKPSDSFEIANRWQAQHPFKDRIPLVGRFFGVKEFPQYGYFDLVRAESKTFGPSIRLVLNPKDPASSLWNQPVGQSGHIRSAHFRDFQRSWFGGEAHRVFPENEDWGFTPMH